MIRFQGKEEWGLVLGSTAGVKKRKKHLTQVGEGKCLAAGPEEGTRAGRGQAVATKVGGHCPRLGGTRSPVEAKRTLTRRGVNGPGDCGSARRSTKPVLF